MDTLITEQINTIERVVTEALNRNTGSTRVKRDAQVLTEAKKHLEALARLEEFIKIEGPDEMDIPADTPVADVALAILKMVREGQKARLALMKHRAEFESIDELAARQASASGLPFVNVGNITVDLGDPAGDRSARWVMGTDINTLTDEELDSEIRDVACDVVLLVDLFAGRIDQAKHAERSKYATHDMSLLQESLHLLRAARVNRANKESAKTDQVREASLGG